MMGLAAPALGAGSGSWSLNALGNWSLTNNWASGTVADGAGATGWFTNNITASRTITIDSTSRTLGIVNVGDANTTHGFTIAATAPVKLTLNNSGAKAQLNQIDTSKGDTIGTTLALVDSVDIANASSNLLTLSGPITNAAPGVRTISNTGAGSGGVTISGIIGSGPGTMAVVQNSGTSLLTLTGANTFTGGVFIKSGMLEGAVGAAFGATSSVITIGDSTGSANATLRTPSLTIANPIAIASNNSGVATIANTGYSIYNGAVKLYDHDLLLSVPSQLALNGGITGKGNLTINATGAGAILLQTSPINFAGAITNSGTGSGLVTISGGVGSNVTAITEASTNSALTINTYSVEVNSGGTTLANNNAAGAALLTVGGGVRGIGDLVLKNNSAIANGITISTITPIYGITNTGRIVNSGSGSGNALISAVIGTNVTGVVQNSATSPLILTAANLYTSGTTIDSGTLRVANTTGSATGPGAVTVNNGGILTGTGTVSGAVTVNSGGMLQGNGTMSGTVTNKHGGMLSPGLDGTAGGTLTMGNLTWNGGGIFKCEIANVPLHAAVAGIDYDQIVVTNSLTAVPGGSNLVIRLDSLGQTPAFETNRNYSLRIITYGTAPTLNLANVTLDTNAFLVGGTWSLTNLNKSIYVVCRGETSPNKNYWRGTGNWSTATNWSLGHAPLAGEDAEFDYLDPANCTADIVSNDLGSVTLAAGYTGTVTILTKYPGQGAFTNMTIAGDCTINGGALTHSANAASEINRLSLTVRGNLTVNAGGQINVDGKGYGQTQGPGKPTGGADPRTGGSYGGMAPPEQGNPGPTYGSILAPINLGSGGYAVEGGGAILLKVDGTTIVNGVISATGYISARGGAGGSVFLTTGALSGIGTIRANGGKTTSGTGYGSGGGGRIALILTNSMDFGTVRREVYTGTAAAGANPAQGSGGTVYLEHTNHTPGQGILVVDYGDIATSQIATSPYNAKALCVTMQSGLEASSYTFSEIILTNGGVYALDTNDTLTIAAITSIKGDPTDRNDGLFIGGTLNVSSPFNSYSNFFIGISESNAMFSPSPSLTVLTNEILRINTPFTLNCPLTIAPGGTLDHTPNVTTEVYKVDLTVNGNLDIQPNGQINADDAGYAVTYGPGKGVSSGTLGASHGGLGGLRYNYQTNGPTYGSIVAPRNIGTGGSAGGGSGGGAVLLNVTGTTIVNGVISASATNAAAAGSGGSVFLTTGALAGNGTISAGSVFGTWQLGGGGRVAVILTNGNDFGAVAVQALSGTPVLGSGNAFSSGGAGTVYMQTRDQGPGGGTLLLNASNRVCASASLIHSNVTGTVVGSVIITNGAVLLIDSNQSLTVNGSWLNQSKPVTGVFTNWTVSFTSAPNSTVLLAGTNAAMVAGTNVFYNLSCTGAVKTVRFAAGTTNTVTGKLALGGGATLQSTVDNAWWYLTLAPGGTQQIGIVNVKDSNAGAGGGQQLLPQKFSQDLGNNINWLFLKSSGMFMQVR